MDIVLWRLDERTHTDTHTPHTHTHHTHIPHTHTHTTHTHTYTHTHIHTHTQNVFLENETFVYSNLCLNTLMSAGKTLCACG